MPALPKPVGCLLSILSVWKLEHQGRREKGQGTEEVTGTGAEAAGLKTTWGQLQLYSGGTKILYVGS